MHINSDDATFNEIQNTLSKIMKRDRLDKIT